MQKKDKSFVEKVHNTNILSNGALLPIAYGDMIGEKIKNDSKFYKSKRKEK